ncbi:SGNH/GDSL hydrolase family protein [Streptomyces milbemycinicus]|uniref:SGNH hydrolase-type esterase domain-containing protein n=1 Tax=Streptomyces milbemycinicus TaxID=476552 RepID=A0ABW8M479_9ACTN
MVVNLGTNDFSTAINPGEPWTPDSLAAAYRTAYGDFLQKLRTRYGVTTTIVAVGTGQFAGHVQQVVKARNDAGDSRVRYWSLDDSGLDFLGCDWHYSAHDDRLISDRLTSFHRRSADGLVTAPTTLHRCRSTAFAWRRTRSSAPFEASRRSSTAGTQAPGLASPPVFTASAFALARRS